MRLTTALTAFCAGLFLATTPKEDALSKLDAMKAANTRILGDAATIAGELAALSARASQLVGEAQAQAAEYDALRGLIEAIEVASPPNPRPPDPEPPEPSETTAKLTWTAPTERLDGSPLEGVITYVVRVQECGTNQQLPEITVTVTEAVVEDLVKDREYCWTVVARDTGGKESDAIEGQRWTQPPEAPPEPPEPPPSGEIPTLTHGRVNGNAALVWAGVSGAKSYDLQREREGGQITNRRSTFLFTNTPRRWRIRTLFEDRTTDWGDWFTITAPLPPE